MNMTTKPLTALKVARVRKGILQWQLAKAVGVDHTKLSMIENGRVLPSEAIKKACSKALGVPVEELFEFEGCSKRS